VSAKAIGDMTRREVMLEINSTWPTLSNDDQARVLNQIDALAGEVGLSRGKLPGRALLSIIRDTKGRQLEMPRLFQSSLP
jgi:hypothetical protein